MSQKQVWIVAGPNGAGKSTLVRRQRKLAARLEVINPDDIALRLDPGREGGTAVLLRAGREALDRREDCLVRGASFLIETTLTGQSELKLIQKARTAGFKVNLAYVGLRRVEMSISRVSERVRRGGHDVPIADLHRRFARSLANVRTALAPANRAYLIDNAGSNHRLLYVVESGRVKYCADTLPAWAAAALADRPQ